MRSVTTLAPRHHGARHVGHLCLERFVQGWGRQLRAHLQPGVGAGQRQCAPYRSRGGWQDGHGVRHEVQLRLDHFAQGRGWHLRVLPQLRAGAGQRLRLERGHSSGGESMGRRGLWKVMGSGTPLWAGGSAPTVRLTPHRRLRAVEQGHWLWVTTEYPNLRGGGQRHHLPHMVGLGSSSSSSGGGKRSGQEKTFYSQQRDTPKTWNPAALGRASRSRGRRGGAETAERLVRLLGGRLGGRLGGSGGRGGHGGGLGRRL